MSSNFTAKIINARVAAQSTFTPAYTKIGTTTVIPARISIPVMITNPPYYVDGVRKEGGTALAYITAYGSLAESCAKYLVNGKEFDCECNISSYESHIKDQATGGMVINAAGQPAVTIKNGFTMVPGSLRYGADSKVQIAKEINSGYRPVGWDGTLPIDQVEQAMITGELPGLIQRAKQGPAAWKAKQEALKALKYTPGMLEFGAAKVEVSPHATPMNAYTAGVTDAVAAATEPKVDGLTYADMIKANWTDELLLTYEGGKYAILVPKKAPAPPVMAPVPPVAQEIPAAPAIV